MTQLEARAVISPELAKRGRTWGDLRIQAEALAEMRVQLAKAKRIPGDWRMRCWDGRISIGNGAYRIRRGSHA